MFSPPADSSGMLPIEPRGPYADANNAEQDVSFGGRRRRDPPTAARRKPWATVAAGVVLVGAFVVGDRLSRTTPAAPATTLAGPATPASTTRAGDQPTSAPTSAAGSDSAGSLSTGSASTGSASPALTAVAPIDPSAAGTGLYVLYYTVGSLLTRFDLATGTVEPLAVPEDLGLNDAAVGVVGSGPSAQAFSTRDLGSDDWSSCSDGTVWTRAPDGPVSLKELRHLRVVPGSSPQVLGTVPLTAAAEQMKTGVIGTTADCRPVLTGPDGRGYVDDPSTGLLSTWNNGLLVSVQQGSYAEVACTDSGQCGLHLHSATGQSVTLPGGGPYSQVSFSHDGLHALAIASTDQGPFAYVNGALVLVDMVSSQVTELHIATAGLSADSPDSVVRSPTWAQWSPNNSIAVLSTGDHLVKVDVASRTATPFASAPMSTRGAQILAIA